MKKIKPDNSSLVPYKPNSLVRAKNSIDLTDKLLLEQAEYYFNQAYSKLSLHDYNGSIEGFNKTILLNPNHSYAFGNRGVAKGLLNDFNGAIENFNKAIELNPCIDGLCFFNRGLAHFNINDFHNAIEDFDKAIELYPNHSDAYLYRGKAKREIQDYFGAIEDFNKAIELNSSYAYGDYNLREEIRRIQKTFNF